MQVDFNSWNVKIRIRRPLKTNLSKASPWMMTVRQTFTDLFINFPAFFTTLSCIYRLSFIHDDSENFINLWMYRKFRTVCIWYIYSEREFGKKCQFFLRFVMAIWDLSWHWKLFPWKVMTELCGCLKRRLTSSYRCIRWIKPLKKKNSL